jgi:hypothetical protein
LHVVASPTKVDTTSWEHVSQQGSLAEVLTFLDAQNIQRLELGKLAWRMKDRDAFTAILGKLRARHVYDGTLWSYALLHRDAPTARTERLGVHRRARRRVHSGARHEDNRAVDRAVVGPCDPRELARRLRETEELSKFVRRADGRRKRRRKHLAAADEGSARRLGSRPGAAHWRKQNTRARAQTQTANA